MNERLLQHYLDAQASRNPDKVAVTDGNKTLSYQELSIFANKLSHCLRQIGVDRQDRVVICLPRSVETVAAILGVLKADAIYIPIDHKTPVDRLTRIFTETSPRLILCDSTTMIVVTEALRKGAVAADLLALNPEGDIPDGIPGLETVHDFIGNEPAYANCADDLAYILFTSGSTGCPKGVMVSHTNVSHYIDWAVDYFEINPQDVILSTAPFHFDMSTFDLYCSLKAGATLCVAGEMQTLFPAQMISFIEQQQVTLWKGVSSHLMYMARAGVLRPGRMPSLQKVLFAGEILPTKYLVDWMTTFPEKSYFNAYGPTETVGVSICHRVDRIPDNPDVCVPIGLPRKGTRVFLLDDQLHEVPDGEVGEICIAGKGVARGYLNDVDEDSRFFVQSSLTRFGERIYRTGDLGRLLPDGTLEYVGRKDRQLKVMGYRIEAEEVERALLAITSIKDSVVDVVSSRYNDGLMELVAFWEAEEEMEDSFISAELAKKLPPYMIPKRFVRVEKMMRSDRGKIDRNALNRCH